MMAVYKMRENWKGVDKPVDYLKPGDVIIIHGMEFIIKDRFPCKDKDGVERLVYVADDEDETTFWAHELERID